MKHLFLIQLSVMVAICASAELTPLNQDLTATDAEWVMPNTTVAWYDHVLTLSKEPDTQEFPTVYRSLELVPGQSYEVVFEYRADNVGAPLELRLEFPELRTGAVVPIVNHNTVWNLKVVPFTAEDPSFRLAFLLCPSKEAGASVEIRRIVLREAGEILPPWGMITGPDQIDGWKFRCGTMDPAYHSKRWNVVAGMNEISAVTPEIWPECDHQLTLTAKLNHSAEAAKDLKWRLIPLDLHGNAVGEPCTGVLTLTAQEEKTELQLKFPAATVYVQLQVNLQSATPAEIDFETISLKRLSERK